MKVIVTLKTGEQIVHTRVAPLVNNDVLTIREAGPYCGRGTITSYPLSSVERWVTQ